MVLISQATADLADAIEVVEEYGSMCEAMYLMMAADGRVKNIERQVMRGALDILSDDRVRSAHMESMIDAAARRVAEHGAEWCLRRVVEALRGDPVRAETTVVLAAAVAAADGRVTPEEHSLLQKLAAGLSIDEKHAQQLLDELVEES